MPGVSRKALAKVNRHTEVKVSDASGVTRTADAEVAVFTIGVADIDVPAVILGGKVRLMEYPNSMAAGEVHGARMAWVLDDPSSTVPDLTDAETIRDYLARAPSADGILRIWDTLFYDANGGIRVHGFKVPRNVVLGPDEQLRLIMNPMQTHSDIRREMLAIYSWRRS